MHDTAQPVSVKPDRCLHLTVSRVTDPDARTVFAVCTDDCRLILGTYDPARPGSLILSPAAA